MATPNFDLYLVTDRTQTRGRDLPRCWSKRWRAASKRSSFGKRDLGGKALFDLAEKTRELCDRYDALLLINDRIDVALAVDAAGVQLNKTSLPISAARTLLGAQTDWRLDPFTR